MRFRLVSNYRPWMTLNGVMHFVAENMRLLERTAQTWIKTDQYY